MINKDDFTFDSTDNILNIASGALKYSPSIIYQFTVATNYLNLIFSQLVTIQVDPLPVIPIANLKYIRPFSSLRRFDSILNLLILCCYRCRFESTCKPYSTFKKVNPSSQITIDGECTEGCSSTSISYEYTVYFTTDLNLTTNVIWQNLEDSSENLVVGAHTSELTLLPKLFLNYSDVLYWKVEFSVISQQATGMASLTFKKNVLPLAGTCFVDKANGTSLLTWFNIICSDWIDTDGSIERYEYLCKCIIILSSLFKELLGSLIF